MLLDAGCCHLVAQLLDVGGDVDRLKVAQVFYPRLSFTPIQAHP